MIDSSQNFFRKAGISIQETLVSDAVAARVFEKLCMLYKIGGCEAQVVQRLAKETLRIARKSESRVVIEMEMHEMLDKIIVQNLSSSSSDGMKENTTIRRCIIKSFNGRSEQIIKQIQDWILGERVLDFGGGNGYIGKKIRDNLKKDVVLVDVVDYNKTDLPFILFDEERLPIEDKSFDTVLFLFVLHHTEKQSILLKEAKRVGKRVIVIETVYHGVETVDSIDGFNETAFFDWFYNRVILYQDIPVCYSFRTANEWMNYFTEEKFIIKHSEYFGQDHPSLFLFHHLFVLEPL